MRKFTYLVGLLFLFSCNDESKDSAMLEVRLVDKPASYDEVNVEVLGVSINYSGEGEETGWQELDAASGVYNLLELTAGNDALLVSSEIPSGTISEIRLLLGESNNVLEGEIEYPLTTPSGQSSGYKIKLQQSFEGGIDYTVILDFDVEQSVKENPQKYILKPVVRASLEALNGAIKGTVVPADADVFVYAIQEPDTIASTGIDEAGAFMFRGMEAGAYTIAIDADDQEYVDELVKEVSIEIGEVKDIGEIELEAVQN